MKRLLTIIFLELRKNSKLRETVLLCFSFALNLVYAVSGMVAGITNQSLWLIAVAFYYLVLGGMKYFVLRQSNKIFLEIPEDMGIVAGIKSYRMCGALMFILNIAMTGMVVQMILNNEYRLYPGYLIYLSAAVTFFGFLSAAFNVAKSRKKKDYLSEAVKMINLVSSLMSVFILQAALISIFGNDCYFMVLMNSVMGGTICFTCVITAIIMICNGNRELKKLSMNSYLYQEEK